MHKVISSDGTSISYHRSGVGAPLILVPGSGAANPVAWTAVLPSLEEHFTVYAVDRRGHGQSQDGMNYSIEREFEDVAEIADSIEEPVNLLGHSFGALCALEAALLARNIRKLILYEPVIPFPGVPIYSEGVIDRLQRLLDTDDEESSLIEYYRSVAMLSSEDIEQLRSSLGGRGQRRHIVSSLTDSRIIKFQLSSCWAVRAPFSLKQPRKRYITHCQIVVSPSCQDKNTSQCTRHLSSS